jgi:hypothetical protein
MPEAPGSEGPGRRVAVFDEQPQDVLPFLDVSGVGPVSELGEEAFEVVGEFEVGVVVGGLGVEGVDLGVQAGFARRSGIRVRSSSMWPILGTPRSSG